MGRMPIHGGRSDRIETNYETYSIIIILTIFLTSGKWYKQITIMAEKKTSKKASEKKVTEEPKEKESAPVQEKKQETVEKTDADSAIVNMERKVLSLCVLGAYSSVKHILKSYKWKDKACSRIAGAINYCEIHGEHISSNSVQLALIKLYPEVKTDITYVTKEVLSPNQLIPFANKLVSLA